MAWKDFTSEMYKKTVLRRLCKHIEIDFENPIQRNIYSSEMEIETDPAEISEREIAENANKEELVLNVETGEVEA
jgi:recombination protein RecT